MTSASFDRIWNAPPQSPEIRDPSDLAGPCPYAVQFQAWVDALLERRLANANRVTINQLKLQIQDRYFGWRERVPVAHRHIGGSGRGHLCLFAVFERAINELQQLELALDPPSIVEIISAPSAPRQQIDGFVVGELEPDSDQ